MDGRMAMWRHLQDLIGETGSRRAHASDPWFRAVARRSACSRFCILLASLGWTLRRGWPGLLMVTAKLYAPVHWL
jgi:hypothetical protein